MSVNVIVLSGRLGRQPEIRNTQSGKSVAKLNLAVDRGFGDKRRTIWVDVEVWDKTAEAVARMATSGSRVTISGELDIDEWNDKNSGEKRSTFKVIANRVDIIDFAEDKQPVDVAEDADSPF
jgi:single-strand DNA-binding protein